jgi:L-seryl-tRNA(Ser) seleniumtransferase
MSGSAEGETGGGERAALLRSLPAVDKLAASLSGVPAHLAVAAARAEIDAARARILAGDGDQPDPDRLRQRAEATARALAAGTLAPVINATGVILHTNLGRAPLAPAAGGAAAAIGAAYSNLELDLEGGTRGSRGDHVEPLICELSGAEAALAVNNNAAAVLLALAALASGREVVVSRGELVEIGGSFRIPDVLAQSGARQVEVGTTNRTRIGDYAAAVGPETAGILRVHQSNFRTVGFVERPELSELSELARERGVAVIDDLGSGAAMPIGDEPLLADSVAAGADIVCCSADKLLGGPQAGILAGRGQAIEACRRHPLARALRLDKLQLAALAATLRLLRDSGPGAIPTLRMLRAGEDELGARAERLAAAIGAPARVGRATSRPGGGTLPLVELEGPVCELSVDDPDAVLAWLRAAEVPVIARVHEGVVLLDPRTMTDDEVAPAAAAARAALKRRVVGSIEHE